MSADLSQVMNEVGAALGGISTLGSAERRHIGTSVSRVTPPAVIVEPSSELDFDQTYGPAGMDLYVLDVTLVVALMGSRSSWAELSPYVSKTGPKSIKKAIEDYAYTACSDVVVPRAEFVVVTFAGVQYLGAMFRAEAGG